VEEKSENIVSRRNFFKLLGGAVALAALPGQTIAKAIEIPVEFGWTWFVNKSKIPSSNLSEIITATLRNNSNTIRENTIKNNALFLKLKDGQKVKLNIEHISEEAQTKRMQERMEEKVKARHKSSARYYGVGNEPKYEQVDNHKEFDRLAQKIQDIIDGKIPHPLYVQNRRTRNA